MFLRPLFCEKQMRQAGFYFHFLFPKKTDEAIFFISWKTYFLFILSVKMLIFWLWYMNIINEATFYYSILKKRQMWGIWNRWGRAWETFFLFGLTGALFKAYFRSKMDISSLFCNENKCCGTHFLCETLPINAYLQHMLQQKILKISIHIHMQIQKVLPEGSISDNFFFLAWWGEEGSNTTISRPSWARQRNTI